MGRDRCAKADDGLQRLDEQTDEILSKKEANAQRRTMDCTRRTNVRGGSNDGRWKLVEKSRIEGSSLFWCLMLTLVFVTICLFRQFVEWLWMVEFHSICVRLFVSLFVPSSHESNKKFMLKFELIWKFSATMRWLNSFTLFFSFFCKNDQWLSRY